MTSFEATLGQLPKPILDKLRAMIGRVRRLLFIRGLFATLAVAMASLLVIMVIDATVTLFSSTARWMLSLSGLAATLMAGWWFLVRPLSRRFTLTHMARILELRHPELQERISTAVELLGSDDPESIRGSAELISAVVDSAIVDVAAVDPKTEFKPARSKKFMLATAIAGGIIALLLVLWPAQSWTLLARAFAPFLDIGNAYADTLVIDPGHVRIAKGKAVTIQVSIQHKRLHRAEIRRLLPDGTEVVERMALVSETDDGSKHFSLTFPSVEDGFDYRVRAGAALSRYYSVVTVDPPSIESLTVNYEYPDYTGLPDGKSDAASGEIRAVAHTRVAITASLNKPAESAKMMLSNTTLIADPIIEENRLTSKFELLPRMHGNWHLEITDEEGFRNPPTAYPIEVLPDKVPTVQIRHPSEAEIRLKPTERLYLELDVLEDFGFGDVTLLVTPEGAPLPLEVAQPAPTVTARAGTYTARALLDVVALKLAPEQRRLAVQVRVRDNRPSDYDGPGVGLSEVVFVTLDESAKALADQAIEARREEVNRQLNETKQDLQRARDEMRRAEHELNRSEELNDKAKEKLKEFTKSNQAAREKLAAVAATLDTPLTWDASRQAEKIAAESLADAQEKADLIPVTDSKDDRLAEAEAARKMVEDSIHDLDRLAHAMREADRDYQAVSKLNELADRQEELARKAADWSERARREAEETARTATADELQEQFSQQQKREAEQFRKEQNRIEQELGEMLKDNHTALAEVLETQRTLSEKLSQEAQSLARQQEALRETSRSATEKNSDQEEALRKAIRDQLDAKEARLVEKTEEAAAERQKSLDQQKTAMDDGKLQEALALMESHLESEAGALATQTKNLARSLRNLQQNQAKSLGDQAGKNLDQGARKAAESARHLARAQEQQTTATRKGDLAAGQIAPQAQLTMRQGQTSQGQSAHSLAEAARTLARSTDEIGQTSEGLEPAETDERLATKGEFAEGFDEVSKSSRSQNAEQAASRSQAAANSLQQLARTAMTKLAASPDGEPGNPDGPSEPHENENLTGAPDSPGLNESGRKTADRDGGGLPPGLQNLGISAEDWARFRGALAGGNASAIETNLPAEYRELIGRYFQVIAKEAGK